MNMGSLGCSAGKESTCNARDTSSIPGSGRSSGEGVDYPLQYSCAFLVTQMVEKNPPTYGLGRSPGGGHGNPLQYSCLENPHGQRSLAGYSPWDCKELGTTEWLRTYTHKEWIWKTENRLKIHKTSTNQTKKYEQMVLFKNIKKNLKFFSESMYISKIYLHFHVHYNIHNS